VRGRAFQPEETLGKAFDFRLMLRLWRYVKPHWPFLAIGLLLIPLMIALELAQPYVLKQAIDVNIASGDPDGLGRLALLYVGLVVGATLLSFGQLYALQLLGQRSMHDLRQAIYRHVITRRAAFYDRVPVGRLLTRMTSDVEAINEMFASGVVTLVADFVKLLAIIGVMLALNVKLTLFTFVTLPILIVLVGWSRSVMRRSFRAIRVKLAAMNAFLAEHLSGIKVVQLFAREKKAAAVYGEINTEYRVAYLGVIKADSGMYAIVEALGVCSAAAIAWYSGGQILKGAVTVGLIVAFVEYVNKFFIPIRDFSAKYTVMQGAMAAVERITELLDTEEDDAPPREPPEGARLTTDRDAPVVELEDVEFAYRPGDPVLRGVSLSVERGETVAVVGATGSGKSTLIRLLARLYEPQSGSIKVSGVDVRDLDPTDLRARLTFVSQDVFLFAGTLADNVRLGRLDATDEQVAEALDRVGATRLIGRREGAMDARVDERGQNFSAGERQLIAFARALLREPDILILDEATAHVDPEAEELIERGLETLMEGRTSFVIAHRLSTIRSADRIVVMQRGEIVEEGSHAELVAAGGVYARLERSFSHQ
jgi:ATP-binding cassette subfamily B protein